MTTSRPTAIFSYKSALIPTACCSCLTFLKTQQGSHISIFFCFGENFSIEIDKGFRICQIFTFFSSVTFFFQSLMDISKINEPFHSRIDILTHFFGLSCGYRKVTVNLKHHLCCYEVSLLSLNTFKSFPVKCE